METIKKEYIDFATAVGTDRSVTAGEFKEKMAEIRSNLDQQQRIVFSVVKFIYEDAYFKYADMTDGYDIIKGAIDSLSDDAKAYLDELLSNITVDGKTLSRDYL